MTEVEILFKKLLKKYMAGIASDNKKSVTTAVALI